MVRITLLANSGFQFEYARWQGKSIQLKETRQLSEERTIIRELQVISFCRNPF